MLVKDHEPPTVITISTEEGNWVMLQHCIKLKTVSLCNTNKDKIFLSLNRKHQ